VLSGGEHTVAIKPTALIEIFIISLGLSACAERGAIPQEMVLIPRGEFVMGEHREAHKIYLGDFYIDRYEVTNAKYKEFIEATGYSHIPTHWESGTHPPDQADHPVVNVNWYDAAAYCKWAGRRLPTEAEWEKAARGSDGREYAWGNTFDKDRANVRGSATAPVGSFENGKSPYGVYDMTGNVWEWTSTLLRAYPYDARDGREDIEAEGYRVLRGGAFTVTRHLTRAARRGDGYPTEKDGSIGVRCVRSRMATYSSGTSSPGRAG